MNDIEIVRLAFPDGNLSSEPKVTKNYMWFGELFYVEREGSLYECRILYKVNPKKTEDIDIRVQDGVEVGRWIDIKAV